MKNILNYKLFESWSEDYTLDFSDHGFEIEENINTFHNINDFLISESYVFDKTSIDYEIFKTI